MSRRSIGIDKTSQAYEMDDQSVTTTPEQKRAATLNTVLMLEHWPRREVKTLMQMLGLIEDEPSGTPKCIGCGKPYRETRKCSRCRGAA